MSETEKMNVQAQGEERAAQEYVQTQELTRNEIMDMAVVMKGVRDYTVSTQNESRLQSVLQSVAVAVVKKFIAVATNNVVGFLEKQALKASLNYLKEIDKQTMLGMMNQGISTLESLVCCGFRKSRCSTSSVVATSRLFKLMVAGRIKILGPQLKL